MMNIIEKKYLANGEPYYFNIETAERYREIVGGIAWSEAKDGFLVIAGLDLSEDEELKARPIRVLAQASESNIDILFKLALQLQKHFSPFTETIRFYGDTFSLAMMEFLDQFNRDRRRWGLNPFYLTEAPLLKHPNKIEFYGQLIKEYKHSERNLLHFCDTVLPRNLMGLSPDEIMKNLLDHPTAAALGYALAVLSARRPRRGDAVT
jgi:hypothetical protein